jgi:hypothetical protein
MRGLMDASKGLVIDSNWREMPENIMPLHELLLAARRVPEILVVLKCKEAKTMERKLYADKIKQEYEELWTLRREKREKERDEARPIEYAKIDEDAEKTPEEKE